jgi:Flp pilus assembly protein CpaB
MRRLGLIILAVAVLLGGGAIWGVLNMQGAQRSASSAQVVVAARPIELGRALTPDMLRLQAWPAGAAAGRSQISELTSGDARVALRAIEPNEPIRVTRSGPADAHALGNDCRGPSRCRHSRNDVTASLAVCRAIMSMCCRHARKATDTAAIEPCAPICHRHVRVLGVDQSANDP